MGESDEEMDPDKMRMMIDAYKEKLKNKG